LLNVRRKLLYELAIEDLLCIGITERFDHDESQTLCLLFVNRAAVAFVQSPPGSGLIDFKVLLLEKRGGAPRPAYQNASGYRWYSQK
jgi:hypothetical protein